MGQSVHPYANPHRRAAAGNISRWSVQLPQPTQVVAPFATTAATQTRVWSSSTSSSRGLRASPAHHAPPAGGAPSLQRPGRSLPPPRAIQRDSVKPFDAAAREAASFPSLHCAEPKVGSPIICCSKSDKSEVECVRSKSIIDGKGTSNDNE